MEDHCDDTTALPRGLRDQSGSEGEDVIMKHGSDRTRLRNDRHLSVHDLKRRISEGEIDTVVVACTDMQGRLQGKRMHAGYFIDHVLEQGTERCSNLLDVDVDMNPVPDHSASSPESRHADLELALDTETLRLLPQHPQTALVQCDLAWLDHRPVEQSPRMILRRQVETAAELGYTALAGTELQLMIFDTSYEAAWNAGNAGPTPANQYNVDYSIVGSGRVEPLLQQLRNSLFVAGMDVASVKGAGNSGQYQIGFGHDDVMITADNHAVAKTMAKEIAAQQGRSITFMAKYDERAGNACHIALSLRGPDGSLVFADGDRRSPLFEHFVAGLLATMTDFALLYAPNVNSYK
jgi:glutamine synthetase